MVEPAHLISLAVIPSFPQALLEPRFLIKLKRSLALQLFRVSFSVPSDGSFNGTVLFGGSLSAKTLPTLAKCPFNAFAIAAPSVISPICFMWFCFDFVGQISFSRHQVALAFLAHSARAFFVQFSCSSFFILLITLIACCLACQFSMLLFFL